MSVTINDTPVTNVRLIDKIDVRRKNQQRGECSLTFIDTEPVTGQRVGVYAGATRIFGGEIDEVPIDPQIGPNLALKRFYPCRCVSWEARLDRRRTAYDVPGDVPVFGSPSYGGMVIPDPTGLVSGISFGYWVTTAFNGHVDGDPIRLTTTGTLPSGFAINTTYYVRDASGESFKLAATLGGAAIPLTDAGSGYHSENWRADNIVKHLIATFAVGESITVGAAVTASGFVGLTVFNWHSVSEALDIVAAAAGFIWYLSPDLDLNFKSRTAQHAPFDITSAANIKIPNARKTREDYRNRQSVRIAPEAIFHLTKTWTGDGTSTDFSVQGFGPIEVMEEVTVDNVAQAIGIAAVDTDKDVYYEQGGGFVRFTTAPPAGSAIVFIYRRMGVNVVTVDNTGEISARNAIEGGSGIHHRIVDDSGNGSVSNGRAVANGLLSDFGSIGIILVYETHQDGLAPGMYQSVTLTALGLSGNFLIDEIQAVSHQGNASVITYSVTCLGGTRLINYVDFFRGLAGGGSVSIGGGSSGGGGGSVTQVYTPADQTLTASTTVITSPATPAEKNQLFLTLKQDATGGRQVTFSSDFHSSTPIDINADPNAVNILQFIAKADLKWHLVGTIRSY